MGEKTPKGKKRSRVNHPEVTPASEGREAIESTSPVDSSIMESLMRSHAELCTALRLAGRQIMRLHGDQEALNKIRHALNKAEMLRKVWKNPERTDIIIPASFAEASTEPFTSGDQAPNPERKRPGRLSRPHPHRVLRFPSGDSSR